MAQSFRICQKCYFERLNKARCHWSTVLFNSTNRIPLKYSVLAKMRHLGLCGFKTFYSLWFNITSVINKLINKYIFGVKREFIMVSIILEALQLFSDAYGLSVNHSK